MQIHLCLATPEGVNVDEMVDKVEIKTIDGNVTILPNHISYLSTIEDGYLKFNEKKITIKKGVIHFENNNLYVTYFE